MYPHDVNEHHEGAKVSLIGESRRVDSVPSTFVRLGDHEMPPVTIDQLIVGHLTILAGGAGLGKTTVAEQLVRHVSSGRQLGRFPLPDKPLQTWCWFLEDVPFMAQDRSLRVASRGTLDEDHTGDTNVRYFFDRGYGLPSLRAELEAAARGEMTAPQLVIIDFFLLLIGTQPSGISVNEWYGQNLRKIRDLGIEFGCAFLVLTHTNKEGKVAGPQDMMNNCDTLFLMEPKGGDDDEGADNEGILRAMKMRMGAKTNYALTKKMNGTWGFNDEMTAAEAASTGVRKDILSVLRIEGPKIITELQAHHAITGTPGTIKVTLSKMRKEGSVGNSHGHWWIKPGDGDNNLRPDPEGTDGRPVCKGCGHWLSFDDGTGYHATCDPDARKLSPAPVPSQREHVAPVTPIRPVETEKYEKDRRGTEAYEQLKASVERSSKHPLPRVKKEARDAAPWTLVTTFMDGEPSHPSVLDFSRPAPDGRLVAVLDRNGSYPSAMSSVAVAPNALEHTGALGHRRTREDRKRVAGIFRIAVPEWTDERVPHPLGRTAEVPDDDGCIWITGPHLEMLDKLAARGAIDAADVLDSWTGVRSTNLFEPFSAWARKAREDSAGTDQAGQVKADIVRAIQAIHSDTPSPVWRPDWHKAVQAEASVRHWMKAYAAVQAGAVLMSLENTDAAAFLVPEGVERPEVWVPDGYTLGPAFGQIKHKDDVIIVRGEKKAPSPLTAAQWNEKGGHRG